MNEPQLHEGDRVYSVVDASEATVWHAAVLVETRYIYWLQLPDGGLVLRDEEELQPLAVPVDNGVIDASRV